MDNLLRTLKKIIPAGLLARLLPAYHYALAFAGALIYRFPSRRILLIGVTGTKGKSTVVEIISHIFETSGKKTALAGTVRFKVGERTQPNLLKMTMPGRFFVQRWLREAVDAGCDVAVLEMTSEGVKQFRHKFLLLDALVFTNLTPEHIESHGSYENYVAAKLEIARALQSSTKPDRAIIVNADSKESDKFLAVDVPAKITYRLHDAEPISWKKHGPEFNFRGANMASNLPGEFNIYNTLAALACTAHFGVPIETAQAALRSFGGVRGRMEYVRLSDDTSQPHRKQDFDIIVDYAHTPDSLKSVYATFEGRHRICILGGTGGGRDKWKRAIMGGIADNNCAEIILTDEDPYDEDPLAIVEDIRAGIRRTPCEVEMDRRAAIRKGIERARRGDVILITGKGTDPYIMGPDGSKVPWDDARVAREELAAVLHP